MQFIETSVFTRQVTSLLADDEYSQLQMALSAQPDFVQPFLIVVVCEKYAGQSPIEASVVVYEPFIIGLSRKIKS